MNNYQIGDLVHVPQAVRLLDCDVEQNQLVIPLDVQETREPSVGVVTEILLSAGYVQIFYEGHRRWVENKSIYKIEGKS